MGDFGYDYDTGDVVYHHDDGFTATGSDGTEFVSVGDNFSVDVNTGEMHYTPTGSGGYSSGGTLASEKQGLWYIGGAICVIMCIVYLTMIDDYGIKYLGNALLAGIGAAIFFVSGKNVK